MTIASPAPPAANPASWLNNQPYLLLSLSSLFWAGNIVLARHVGAHVPPLTITTIRWFGVFLILLPFAWPHLKRDWPALRKSLPLMLFLSLVGFAFNNAISYWALQYTEALNALLIQSAGPLFVALWSLVLFGVRLTGAQLGGIAISLLGVLIIILRGDLAALASISFNRGDIMFASSLVAFGLYSAFIPRRPKIHQLSFLSFTTCCGATMLLPTAIWGGGKRQRAAIRRDHAGDAGLHPDLSLHPRLSLLQPRRGADRAEPCGAVLPSGAGVRLGAGDPAAG
ncbi:drug/metabolite transporter (DMT)-like permease [Bradyrhizobium sp. USDA 372]